MAKMEGYTNSRSQGGSAASSRRSSASSARSGRSGPRETSRERTFVDRPTIRRHLDDPPPRTACDRFEAAWQSGLRPSIEDYLGDAAGARPSGPAPRVARPRPRLPPPGRRATDAERVPGPVPGRSGGDRRRRSRRRIRQRPDGPATRRSRRAGQGVPDIPGYAVLEELGRGGMGVVFKATADRLNRIVALKMILAGDLAGPEAAARFLAEAEAVARLQHPQVVQIFRIGDCTTAALSGDGVRRRREPGGPARRHGPGSPDGAARLVESLARAVHHAHLRGIVHRDLKPANILLTADGDAQDHRFRPGQEPGRRRAA